MNPLPVTINFTENIQKNNEKQGSSNQSANSGSFEKELKKQEKVAENDRKSESSSNVDERDTATVGDKNKGESVAADSSENGEALADESSAADSESVVAGNADDSAQDTSAIEDSLLGFDAVLQQSELSELSELDVDKALTSGEFVPLTAPLSQSELKLSAIAKPLEVDKLAMPGGGMDVEVLPQPLSVASSLAPANGVLANGLPGLAEGGNVLNAPPQPTEKLLVLNQLKASLEAGADIPADIDVDVDTETTIKQANSFSDIQLKEARAALRTYTTSVDVPFTQTEWGDKVNDKIMWLANQKIQYAEIHISPADLGPVEVKINVQNDQATVVFNSNNQGVRELLELNVHRLREMMGENGVDLSHVDVSDQSSQQQSQDENEGGHSVGQGDVEHVEADNLLSNDIVLDNLIDYYA